MLTALCRRASRFFLITNRRSLCSYRPCVLSLESRITPAIASFSSGTLTINYTATGSVTEDVTITNDGTNLTLYGDVSGSTIVSMSSVSKIIAQDSGNSNSQSLTFDVFSSKAFSFSNGVTSTGVEVVSFDMAVAVTSSGVISITAPGTIIVNDVISTVNGDITLKANTQVTPMTGNFDGIDVFGEINSTKGNITLEGRGGNDSSGNQWGVLVYDTAIVGGGTTGKVSVTGTGGASSGLSNYGVSLYFGGTITSGGGNVSVTGTGGGTGSGQTNFGISVDGVISAGGSGSVTVNGTGGATSGAYNFGVYVISTGSITSAGGAVSVTGQGGGTGSSSDNHGVVNDGPISALGTGSVTIQGTGGATNGPNNIGAWIDGDVSTFNGSISITGQGGGTGAAASNIGVYLSPYTVSAGGAGAVIVQGTAGATSGVSEHGVFVDGCTITTNAGALTITGIQGNASGEGVHVENSASITSGGSASLTINSTGMTNLSQGTLTAGGDMNLNSTGAITQFPVGNVFANSGTLTVNAPSQTVTFGATGNKAAQLVIPSGVTAMVNGSFDATGFVQVSGTLGGSGSVGTVTVTGTGEIAPGKSPGKLTTNNITFNSGAALNIEINGSNPITEYDQLVVLGTVNLGGATLKGTVGFYVPPINQKFTIIDNDGSSDAVTGTFNGIVEGGSVTIGGYAFSVSYKGGNGNDVTLTRIAATAPTVTGVTFGDGTNQRSMVKQIVVTFSESVNFSGTVANAFTLFRHGTGAPTGNVTLAASPTTGAANSVTITFSGPLTTNGSLNDGFFDFTIDANQVTGVGGKLDGGGGAGSNYSVVGNTTNKFFRLFGDADGSGITDLGDFAAFRSVFNLGANPVFDYDNSGNVDLGDFAQFRARFNLTP